ncbi:MAG TPA: TetR/AcrR family transcriptional regulator [Solirubrobacteraceae bacterium]
MSSYASGIAWQGEPLPRGRHKLDPEEVRGSQRRRICRAMLEVVAEHGFQDATVGKVVAAARVSRNAFYEFFSDKTDCFLTASAELNDELLEAVLAARAEADWIVAVRRGTVAYLEWWRQHAAFARAYFTGYAELGARAVEQRHAAYEPFVAMFAELGRLAREQQPELGPLPPIVPRVLVFSITELVADEIRAGRSERIDDLAPDLFELIVRLLADDETARAVAA